MEACRCIDVWSAWSRSLPWSPALARTPLRRPISQPWPPRASLPQPHPQGPSPRPRRRECSSPIPPTRPTPPTKTGGTVTLAEWRYPATINPYFAVNSWEAEVNASMFDGLVKVTPDLRYVPNLVSTIPTLDNGGVVLNGSGMDVTWQLRSGMRWSDSQPINCDDLRATWLWIMDPGIMRLTNGTVGWQDISGVDGGTGNVCVVHFSKVYEGYLTLVSALLPAHYLSTVPPKDAAAKLYPMGNLSAGVYSGPYIPASAKPSSVDHTQAESQLADNRRSPAIPRSGQLEVLRRRGHTDSRLQGGRFRSGARTHEPRHPCRLQPGPESSLDPELADLRIARLQQRQLQGQIWGRCPHHHSGTHAGDRPQADRERPTGGQRRCEQQLRVAAGVVLQARHRRHHGRPSHGRHDPRECGLDNEQGRDSREERKDARDRLLHHVSPASRGHPQAPDGSTARDRHQGQCLPQTVRPTSLVR